MQRLKPDDKIILTGREYLIAMQRARAEEWRRIYRHFDNIKPYDLMPDETNPRNSVLIELKRIEPEDPQ